MANIGRGYSWSNNKYDNSRCVIQDPPKPREYQELCSINTIKDNYALLENTLSQTNIISRVSINPRCREHFKTLRLKKHSK